MTVSAVFWTVLGVLVVALLALDFIMHARHPHPPTMRQSVMWTGGYVGLAVIYGLGIALIYGWTWAGEYYAGWITEWSLSVDNLFVFILILNSFCVPRNYQQKALLAGIIIALVLRLAFILLGAALIQRFSWVFYIFGAFLLYTAVSQIREARTSDADKETDYVDTAMTRLVRRVIPTTDGFVGDKFFHRHSGRTFITPLLICVLALGAADLMFAFDSIPAIFGLTQEPFLVFSATAFSLLGLRQLFFLIDGLLERLVFLPYGLAVILGFIGFKLINHALHTNGIGVINHGHSVDIIPEPSTALSLGVIVGTLAVVAVASVMHGRKNS